MSNSPKTGSLFKEEDAKTIFKVELANPVQDCFAFLVAREVDKSITFVYR